MTNVYIMAILAVLVAGFLAWRFARQTGFVRQFKTKTSHLKSVPLFAGLDSHHLQKIADLTNMVTASENTDLFTESEQGSSLYIIIKGKINILRQGTLKGTLVKTLGPGAIIGEIAILTGAERNATGRAVTKCVCLRIDQDDFSQLMAEEPDMYKRVWDACDVHSLEMLISDQPLLRKMNRLQRRIWIESRNPEMLRAESRTPPAGTSYLGVISGEAKLDGTAHHAPALVSLDHVKEVHCTTLSRVVWLQSPFD